MQHTSRTDTKAALIRAAERLFAEKGLGTVSVKDITVAAGARNPSAVHYHFGNIEALIREVFTRRYEAIEKTRLERLAEIDAAGDAHKLDALMEAGIGPLFEACLEEDGRLYARFCHQLSTDPRFDVVQLVQDVGVKSATWMRDRLLESLSDLPEDVLRTRLRQIFSITLVQTADFARQVELGTAPSMDVAVREAAVSLAGYLSARA